MPSITADDTDGLVANDQNNLGVHDGWIACRNSPTGSEAANSTVRSTVGTYVKKWDTSQYTIRRSFFAFDTSGVASSDVNCASAATLKIYGYSAGTGDVIIVKATAPDLSTGVATGDFNALYGWNSSFEPGDLTVYSSEVATWSTSGYNDITLNAQARKDMNSLSVFKIAIIEYDYDYLGVEYNPGANGEVATGMYYNHSSALSNGKRPYIDYTEGACGYGNNVNGIATANIGKITGIATADIEEVMGIPD